ncbi:MAG: TonB-dependent receptor [Bacteroidota bacterium]
MKNYLVILLMGLSAMALFAQPVSVKGLVLDEAEQPLSFANVLLLDAMDSSLVKGTITETDGSYRIEEIAPANYLMQIVMIGYTSSYQPLNLASVSGEALQPIIRLKTDANLLEEIVVKAQKPLFEQRIDRLVVNVQQSVTSAGGTAFDVLSRSPGVRIDGISNQISLDGNQGVLVEINGKRSRLNGAALLQLLQSMPASNIEKIELINTPPASYDADGVGGIINIVLVKNLEEGLNGNFSVHAGYGQRAKFGGALDLNFRRSNWNIFADFASNFNYLQHDVTIEKTIAVGGDQLATNTLSDRPAHRHLQRARLGVDYEIGEKTTLGVLLSAYVNGWDMDASTISTTARNGLLEQRSDLSSQEQNNWEHWMTNVNFRHTFPSQLRLSADYDYLYYFNTNPADYQDRISDDEGALLQTQTFFSRKENPINFHVFKTDFVQPLQEGWNLEFGAKGALSDLTNDNQVADVFDDQFIERPAYTNVIHMDERIYATYLSMDFQLSEATSAKAGVRYEYTDIQLNSGEEILTSREYGRFFPTLYLSHNLDDNNSFQLSYSERIQRPTLGALAPAFFFFSPTNLTTGNPSIREAISRNFRASLRHKTVMLNLIYSDEDQPMFWGQLDVVPEENLTVIRPENMQDAQQLALFLSLPVNITPWWESRCEGGIAYQWQNPIFEGELVQQRNVFAGINTTQTFKFSEAWVAELDGFFQTPWDTGLARRPIRYSFNLGVRWRFEDGSSFNLNVSDVFNLGSFFENNYDFSELNLVHRQRYDQEGNIFRISLSKPFGNKRVKQKEQRNSASSDERNRVQ